MKYMINARISNRHVHLTKEVYEKLFDEPMTKRNDLQQKGEFASNETVTLKLNDKKIENVRVVGPFRNYNQIEISKRDAHQLKVNPPVRKSGDIENTPEITLVTAKGEVVVGGLIIANRHIHMSKEDALKLGVEDGEKVAVKIEGPKSGIMDAQVKVSANGVLELHIDTDDANAFLIEDNDKVTMIV